VKGFQTRILDLPEEPIGGVGGRFGLENNDHGGS
jgi:hypothetical protein